MTTTMSVGRTTMTTTMATTMIDPRLRRKKRTKGGGGGALMLNIRVRHIRKKGAPRTPPSRARDALQALLDTGRMPSGWQFMFVDWKNPQRHGSSWESGWPSGKHADDPDEFREAFTHVVQSVLAGVTPTRVGEVRKL